MKFKFNRQNGIKDCDVSCLYNIIRFYNGNISFEKLRKMAKTNKNGTSVYEIVLCANKLGLISYAYECTFDNLKILLVHVLLILKLIMYIHIL